MIYCFVYFPLAGRVFDAPVSVFVFGVVLVFWGYGRCFWCLFRVSGAFGVRPQKRIPECSLCAFRHLFRAQATYTEPWRPGGRGGVGGWGGTGNSFQGDREAPKSARAPRVVRLPDPKVAEDPWEFAIGCLQAFGFCFWRAFFESQVLEKRCPFF